MASVTSKTIAVTGGASGIGAATCQLLAQRGASVICIGDISDKGFHSITQHINEINSSTQVHCTVLDVASSAEVEKWMAAIITTFGNLDGAANIAGIAQAGSLRQTPAILEETDEAWTRIMRVNLDGVFHCTRAEVQVMKNLPVGDRSIVNVASVAALHHIPDAFAYGTSKGACVYFTTCVASDTFPLGIRVNSVSPGITNTPLLPRFQPAANSIDDIKELYRKEGFSLIEPHDVARTIVWLLSEDSRPVYGANINVGACIP
ncbi:short chain dehydrogenase/oxidoreductase CpoX2 [Annulohypoxylon truncatum]|uniref:short chain dehydrogenase/oxidoreductase CpoX2 n=1 Tax=Annulohypoxylon truncatum TaxID=327061 RepID=UPI002008650F|nr:short chain dehydrogenase/oxidoreductase CpoX2 [Annulohypoxylon truncatum]KAI1214329.1 short chain dehydrogenase/oxidoreductase CpoX2 [Annulohypoxylon truncatum]